MVTNFERILIANRGEIALRVARTCKEQGIETVAIYSEADHDSLHVKQADKACCVGAGISRDSYMNIPNIICAALHMECDAIHPGYGFLAEDSRFAEICEAHEIKFIGPSPLALKHAGDKFLMRHVATGCNVPVLPASDGRVTVDNANLTARKIGYPVVLKPRSGGGGLGIRHAMDEHALRDLLIDSGVRHSLNKEDYFMEHFLGRPRHIEVQMLVDSNKNFQAVGLRDCSIQRRKQKVIEESPPVRISKDIEDKLIESARCICKSSDFTTAGTAEFLVDGDKFYFLELNPRIQVEHTVTEMLTGIDLVWEQIRLAGGDSLENIISECNGENFPGQSGHSIQARIYAEPPIGLSTSTERVGKLRLPGGPGVRVDTHLYPGCSVPYIYDPLLVKVIAWASTRKEALKRLRRALDEIFIGRIKTNLPFLKRILGCDCFGKGEYHTRHAEEIIEADQLNEEAESKLFIPGNDPGTDMEPVIAKQ
ncbi:MAG: acetyl-CoA carboxylase biotin carboxylase subunit [Actinobacteria bacterium]|nr:acetyl-CoA carboxylase biotin carboxylase subunit [Actinomycetota bacterium]